MFHGNFYTYFRKTKSVEFVSESESESANKVTVLHHKLKLDLEELVYIQNFKMDKSGSLKINVL